MDSDLKKRGFDVYYYYWVFFAFIILLLINYSAPIPNVEELDLRTMISIVTFLFGFLISISFNMILSRVSSLRDTLASETARVVSLFSISKNLGKKFHESIIDKLDNYTILTLRHYEDYEIGRDIVYSIYDDLGNMETKNEFQRQQAGLFTGVLNDFEVLREKLEYLTSIKLVAAIKIANYLLSSILIILLFMNRGNVFTNSLFVILSTIIIFIILIIEDYDDLRIGDYVNNISNSEQIFDLIGKERYYPKFLLGRVNLEKGKNYRIGFYDSVLGKEEIISLKYNPGFEFKINTLVDKLRKKKVLVVSEMDNKV